MPRASLIRLGRPGHRRSSSLNSALYVSFFGVTHCRLRPQGHLVKQDPLTHLFCGPSHLRGVYESSLFLFIYTKR